MNKYAIVFYESDDDFLKVSAALKRWGVHEAPYHAAKTYFFHYPKRKMIVHGVVSNTSAFESYECLDLDKDGGVVFDGAPYFLGINSKEKWATQIRRYLDAKSPSDALSTILGDFSACVIGRDTVYAISDFIGLNPIFYTQVEGIAAISNRQRLLQRITRPEGRLDLDPDAASWIPGHANVFGENSLYRGVKLVSPGRAAIYANGKFRIVGMRRYYEHEARSEDFDSLQINDMVDSLFNQADAAAELPFGTMRADLTGGMDSRAVLALVMGSKLRDKVDTFITNGSSENGDIQVARMIQRELGVPHVARISPPSQEQPIEALWSMVRRNVAGTDGTVIGNAGVTGQSRTTYVSASGSGGEIYRPHVPARRTLTLSSLAEAQNTYEHYQVRTDPFHILRNDVKAERRNDIHRMCRIYDAMGVPYDDMHYVLYGEHRCPWWAGYTNANTFDRKRLPLMVNFKAAQIMSSASARHRKADRLHFEVMRRFDKRLLSIPFLDKSWHTDLAAIEPHLDFIKPAFKAGSDPGGIHWTVSLANRDWGAIFDYILSKEDSFIFGFSDRRALSMRRAEKEKWSGNNAAILSLISLLSLRILEDEDYQPVRQGTEPAGGIQSIEATF